MASLKASGIAIPEEVAVIGFSDWKMAAFMDPPLSSVYQPGFEMGKIGADILLKEIHALRKEAFFAHEIITLDTSLRLRKSSLVTDPFRVER
jgi:LacI family transcriptional regulator